MGGVAKDGWCGHLSRILKTTVGSQVVETWNATVCTGVYLPLNLGYIITHCEPDYSYSIVGLADRSNLWVLSRTPRLPPAQYAEALRKVESQGFDMSKVLRVQNPMHENESAAGSIGGGTVFQDIAAEPQAEKTSL